MALQILTCIAIKRLESFEYMTPIIAVVYNILFALLPITIFLFAFCFAAALVELELRKHVTLGTDVITNYYPAFRIQWDYIFGNFIEPNDFTIYLWLFHMFFSFVLNLMAGNLVISVISEKYSELSEIKEILSAQTKCRIT